MRVQALVIEDEPIARMRHSALLRSMGYQVQEATDGIAAMNVLRETPDIRLALVDWYMEPLNGYAFAAAMRAERRYDDMVLIMVTAEDRPEKISQAMAVGVDAHLIKPLRPGDLRDTLRQIDQARLRVGAPVTGPVLPPHRRDGGDAPFDTGPGRRIGAYQIEQLVGQGASSRVYRARHHASGATVAIKLLHLSAIDGRLRKRFAGEAGMMASLRHRHLINLIEVGRVGDSDYLVMEYADGGDAIDLIRTHGGRLDQGQATRLIRQCAEGLAAIHAAGVAHRDIKPSNLFLTADGDAKLGDFGLALDRHREAQLTADGMTVGTPAYMAPEQIQGLREHAHASDIYSLGATWYHLLTGRPPFDQPTAYATFVAVEREAVPDPASFGVDLDDRCWRAVQTLMAKHHDDRPASAAATIALLDALDDATNSRT